MYSSSSSATHHIFFPPRLQVVVEQENPNGFPSHLGDQFSFDDLLGHQPHRPSSAPSWWSAANHGNDPLLLAFVQQLGRSWTLLVVQRAIQIPVLVALPDVVHGFRCQSHIRRHLGNRLAIVYLGQNQSPKHHARGLDASAQYAIDFLTVPLGQLHAKPTIGPHAPEFLSRRWPVQKFL